MTVWLGIDFGTSGARAIAIDADGNIQDQAQVSLEQQHPDNWQAALWILLDAIDAENRANLEGRQHEIKV